MNPPLIELLHWGFVQRIVLVALLAALAAGMMGSLVVARRTTYLAAAIAHCTLGGIGAAAYLSSRYGLGWCTPMLGATVSAILAALAIGLLSLGRREREDTIIGAVWTVGMAVGLLLLAHTPGYVGDPLAYVFGDILLISRHDVPRSLLVDGVILLVLAAGWRPILAVSFDPDFAALRGIRAARWHLLLLVLTALCVVVLVKLVGIVLAIALLTLPGAIAGRFTRTLGGMMAAASAVAMLASIAGLAISYLRDLPAGPTIVIVAAGLYLLVRALTVGRG